MTSFENRVLPTDDDLWAECVADLDDLDNCEGTESYESKDNGKEQAEEKQSQRGNHSEEIKFVRDHFHQKECHLFIPDREQFKHRRNVKARLLKCLCGETLSWHAGVKWHSKGRPHTRSTHIPPEYVSALTDPDASLNESSLPACSKEWKKEEALKRTTTNAFGRIDFNVETVGGKKPAKYLRLTDDDSLDDCIELMTKHWRMMEPEPPSLVISVVGGAKNFQMDTVTRDIFNAGLIKAAKTTKAWIITSGGNMGVMKAVGDAIHKGQSFVWVKNKVTHLIRCIGITPWGYVRGRQCLEKQSRTGKFNAFYRTSNDVHYWQPVALNPFHTHFLFLDNGFRSSYSGVTEFRADLEKRISEPAQKGGLGIPLVQILLEGGVDAIDMVHASVSKGIPVIVCAGSGRAANIFAYAYKQTFTSQRKNSSLSAQCKEKLAKKIYVAFPGYCRNPDEETQKKRLDATVEKVIDCCCKTNLITIFQLNGSDELDMAILSVLLKGKKNASSTRQKQLLLAMAWNRIDVAQSQLFREDANWEEGSLEKGFTHALVTDKHQFVKLMLNKGVVMRDYLTRSRLQHLYNVVNPSDYLHRILMNESKKDHFTVDDICAFLTSVLDKYEDDKIRRGKKTQRPPKNPIIVTSQLSHSSENNADFQGREFSFKQPYKHLFIWAVLFRRKELAKLFWEYGDEPIMTALVASRLCGEMEFKFPKYLQTVRDSFHQMKEYYEELSIKVLDECHANDPEKAVKIVEKPSQIWSEMTCLQVASAASDYAFVSSVACQNSINNVWKKDILSSWPKVFFGAIFPPAILLFVNMAPANGRKLSKWEKITSFYTSPLTKFSIFTAVYAVFLAVFSYMLLVDFKDTPSTTEWICIFWIVNYLIGGIHAFVLFPSPTLGSKLRDYLSTMDRLDLFNLLLACVAFCVRWNYVFEGKVIYCINAVLFYTRVLKLYTGNRTLGPKIYMINKMVAELIMFVMVLMVFLLAYGVASQGLLYRHRNNDWTILKDIIYFPYWQLYGEIFLEEIETDDTCTSSLSSGADNTCRTFHPLVPILLAVYLLVGNVLLLNILIAIFSRVFESVEKNAIQIWKFQMYFLVMDFVNRPLLPPPFSLLSYAFFAARWIYRKLCSKHSHHAHDNQNDHKEFLTLFEKEMMTNKLRFSKLDERNTVKMKLALIEDRLDELTRIIEEEFIMEQETNSTPSGQRPQLEESLFASGDTKEASSLERENTDLPPETHQTQAGKDKETERENDAQSSLKTSACQIHLPGSQDDGEDFDLSPGNDAHQKQTPNKHGLDSELYASQHDRDNADDAWDEDKLVSNVRRRLRKHVSKRQIARALSNFDI